MKKYIIVLAAFFWVSCAVHEIHPMSVESFSKRIESRVDSIPKKALMYDICSINYENNEIKYPCSMGDSLVRYLIEHLTMIDSSRHMNISVMFIYYSAEIFTYRTQSQHYKLFTRFSPIYVYEDGSKRALCSSNDGVHCSYPVAELKIERMYSKSINVGLYYNYPLFDNLDVISMDSILKNVYINERIDALDIDDNKFTTFKLCKNGQMNVPCDMDSSFVAEMADSVKKIGRELESITYGLDSIMDCGADVYNLMVDNPVCTSALNGACRYVIIKSIDSGAEAQSVQSFVYDKETKKFGKCDSGPEISICNDNEWPFHKPDGTSLRDYRWQ